MHANSTYMSAWGLLASLVCSLSEAASFALRAHMFQDSRSDLDCYKIINTNNQSPWIHHDKQESQIYINKNKCNTT